MGFKLVDEENRNINFKKINLTLANDVEDAIYSMKWILSIILTLSLSGCSLLGTNMIHSPSADEGIPWKYRHVHGGATKNAPPDAIIIQVDDSTRIIVNARTIWQKNNFGGILIPIFPIFWLPKINSYKDQPNSLIIELSTIGKAADLEINAAVLITADAAYSPHEIKRTESKAELNFPLAAEQVTDFKLTNLSVIINDECKSLPEIRFKKMKQRMFFIGP